MSIHLFFCLPRLRSPCTSDFIILLMLVSPDRSTCPYRIVLVLQANCSWRGHVCLSEVYHCCTADRTSQMFSSILQDLQQLAAVVALLFVQSCTTVTA